MSAIERVTLAAALFVAACGHAAMLAEPPQVATPWCVSIEAERFGEVHATKACADDHDLCDFARDRAIYFAGLAHFTTVGVCHVEA